MHKHNLWLALFYCWHNF